VTATSLEPPDGDVWIALSAGELPLTRASAWAVQPSCGALVVFCGTVRDHAEGRPGVSELAYEAYESQVLPRLSAIASEAKRRWPGVGRLALWHRTGNLAVGECSVVVAASAEHRGDAFDASRYCIDTLKQTVPIWKRERWEGGEDWGTDARDVTGVGS
jgi:molybdopterin synthase catalytic subunit